MNTNDRRPEGWTSADAAGLAILPGLIRYDEAWNPSVTDIGHAFRVTVRATNGYVYPASHEAGSTAGALPMGARLRLKTDVGGLDPALRTSDPNVQKIFRAMQKYGLIVADNGTDMYITGTFDTRWDNDILNPAFALLSASDFDVVELGWQPTAGTAALLSLGASPSTVVGGNPSIGSTTLTSAAPTAGALVSLSSASGAVSVPASVTVGAGATSGSFGITTSAVAVQTLTTLSASYNGVTKTTTVTTNPALPTPALAALTLKPASVRGGTPATGTATLTARAPRGGASVVLSSSSPALASVPANVVVPAGQTSAAFAIATTKPQKGTVVTISATYAGAKVTATMTVTRQ